MAEFKKSSSSSGSRRGGQKPPGRASGKSRPRQPAFPKKTSRSEDQLTDAVWGMNPVLELLRKRPKSIERISILKSRTDRRCQEIIRLAEQNNIPIHHEERFRNRDVEALPHQGVLARIAPVPTLSLEEVIGRAGAAPLFPVLLALDCIQDPHNLGAILRSAAAAGVSAVILPKDRSAPLSGTVVKASAGALAHIDICMVTNLVSALKRLKKENYWVFGADKDGGKTIYEADFACPVCLVVGGEGKGIRPLVKKECDQLVTIPMQGSLDSLNVSVATAIILFEIVRRRHLQL